MISLRMVTVAIPFLVAVACGDQEVGIPCEADADCLGAMFCETDLPGGYCTEGCPSMGMSCGEGDRAAYCASNGVHLMCSAICRNDEGCRADYTCEDAPGTIDHSMLHKPPLKVCVLD